MQQVDVTARVERRLRKKTTAAGECVQEEKERRQASPGDSATTKS